jgi:hypothetical protein
MDYSDICIAVGNISFVLAVLSWRAKSRYFRVLYFVCIYCLFSWKLPSLNLSRLETLVAGFFLLLTVSFVTAIVDQAGGMKLVPRLFFSEGIKDHVATTVLAAILVLPPLYLLY